MKTQVLLLFELELSVKFFLFFSLHLFVAFCFCNFASSAGNYHRFVGGLSVWNGFVKAALCHHQAADAGGQHREGDYAHTLTCTDISLVHISVRL